MALIGPEVVGLARVNVPPQGLLSTPPPFYEFVNGFDAVKVKGAREGAPVIFVPTAGTFVLFLSEPIDPGTLVIGGGIKATVDAVAVSTPAAPSPSIPPVKARWYYGAYDLSGNPLYANVNPEKAIVVELYDSVNLDAWTGPATFDISVIRDPMTEFVGKTVATGR